jgi:hypothetical protein
MFATLEAKLIAGAIAALFFVGLGFSAAWEIQSIRIADLEKADAVQGELNAKVAALTQGKLDQNAIAAANADAAQARETAARTAAQVRVVHDYVTKYQDAHNCVTWGLVRVYDAAAIGTDASALSLPPGVTNDTCSPDVVSSALADGIVRNFGRYRVVAGHFNQLVALDAANDTALKESGTKPPTWWERNNPF